MLKMYKCLNCGKECKHSYHNKANKFCSNSCQHELTKQTTYNRILEGQVYDRGLIRKTLIWKHGRKCWECGLEEWRGHPIPIEVDHIDGNAGNNSFSNIRLICANCHGITPTWKGKNKGNGRASRGLPLS